MVINTTNGKRGEIKHLLLDRPRARKKERRKKGSKEEGGR